MQQRPTLAAQTLPRHGPCRRRSSEVVATLLTGNEALLHVVATDRTEPSPRPAQEPDQTRHDEADEPDQDQQHDVNSRPGGAGRRVSLSGTGLVPAVGGSDCQCGHQGRPDDDCPRSLPPVTNEPHCLISPSPPATHPLRERRFRERAGTRSTREPYLAPEWRVAPSTARRPWLPPSVTPSYRRTSSPALCPLCPAPKA